MVIQRGTHHEPLQAGSLHGQENQHIHGHDGPHNPLLGLDLAPELPAEQSDLTFLV